MAVMPTAKLEEQPSFDIEEMEDVATEDEAIEEPPSFFCPDHKLECYKNTETCCPFYKGGYACCPFVNAVCCQGGKVCCPQGYTCHLEINRCIRNNPAVSKFSIKNCYI